MVSPLYLIVIALATAFLLGLFRKAHKDIQIGLTSLALLSITIIAGLWVYGFLTGTVTAVEIFTAGFGADSSLPLSINLYMGRNEAVLLLIVNLSTLLSSFALNADLRKSPIYVQMLLLVSVVGLNGIILTRDLFNLFVFIEIASISAAGLIAIRNTTAQLGAGFKFIIAGALASGLMLLGIVFNYYVTGSLNIDTIAALQTPMVGSVGFVGLFLIFMGVIIELKPFPVNGWGVDVYEASEPAVSAFTASATATAMFFAFTKVIGMSSELFLHTSAVVGSITFVAMNIIALKQTSVRRILGYSSISQIGLLVLSFSLVKMFNLPNGEFIVFGLLVSHALAKASLFWLSAIIKEESIDQWGIIKKEVVLIFAFGIAIAALLGLPPFPSFFAKWDLFTSLASNGGAVWITVILVGSIIEAVYLVRWFGNAVKDSYDESATLNFTLTKFAPVVINTILLISVGVISANLSQFDNTINWLLMGAVGALFILEFLPAKVKNVLLISAIGWYGISFIQGVDGYRQVFASIFAVGAVITLIPGFTEKGKRVGFYPSAALMFAGLIGIIEATDFLAFFFSWEIMTIGSYFLILRGKKSKPHALSYMLFSLGGAYLILTGFALTYGVNGGSSIELSTLANVATHSSAGFIMLLLSVGFMTKLASGGLHIWLPGAHAEAEGDVSPMVSGILLKAGVFGLLMTFIALGDQSIGKVNIAYVLGWIGAITALTANYMAAMQEDAKKLLAYSSIGQMGYALFGLSLMSHLGWLAAISLSIVHFTYKVILFLAIGGVVYRVKTKNMFEMGGLIKRMPLTFTFVLISIIALSGIPPLAGFSGRWITYNAVLQKGWLLQGAVVGVSGLIAFLYLFRLIYAIFLGQLKDAHRKVKEAPLPYLIPQILLIGVVMYLSMAPGAFLRPLGEIVSEFHTEGALVWSEGGKGFAATSNYGYWNGVAVMWVFMGLFAMNTLILLWINRGAQMVKQFNIVFAAERPARPETTHFAYNFFAPYRKAIGFLEYPLTTNFWNSISDLLHSIAGFARRIYTGNGQTYLFHILIFVVVTYMIINGGN
jgi:formate hydrogenlyase subunit 3/multisubunit Na+/H+ antiporter MnhD subunit